MNNYRFCIKLNNDNEYVLFTHSLKNMLSHIISYRLEIAKFGLKDITIVDLNGEVKYRITKYYIRHLNYLCKEGMVIRFIDQYELEEIN